VAEIDRTEHDLPLLVGTREGVTHVSLPEFLKWQEPNGFARSLVSSYIAIPDADYEVALIQNCDCLVRG
jgi:hypothetical protein